MKLTILFALFFGFGSAIFAQDTTQMYLTKANNNYKLNLYRDAEFWLIKAMRSAPKNYDIQTQLGLLYTEKLKQPKRGLDILNNVIHFNPNHTDAIEGAINVYLKNKSASHILGIVDGLKNPKKINIALVKGKCKFWQNSFFEASQLLQDAIKQLPKNYEANYFLAESLMGLGNNNKALDYYENAIKYDTTKSTFLLYDVGVIFYNEAQYKKAFEYLTKAKNAGISQTAPFVETYSQAAVYSGNKQEGKTSFDNLIATQPGNNSLVYTAGEIFYEVKEYDIAIEYFSNALRNDAKNYRALYMAGLCFKKLGDTDRGNQYCDKAIASDPALASMRNVAKPPAPRFGL
jgi:tetratricopeptide (TPR) repeat protein